MQRIVPHFWLDHNAQEAVEFYISVFKDSKINAKSYYPKTDFQKDLAGKLLTVDFKLSGYNFIAINGYTTFKPNPSISFFYTCDAKEETDTLWKKLADGGKPQAEGAPC
jgi:predicted 3-demethylubiquinone-9 3-methyltransferase (glyoxalase superfamily)